MANRAIQRENMRRFSHRQAGGGYGIVGSLLPIPSDTAQFDYNPRVDNRIFTDDCTIPDRAGQLHNQANPSLAQAGWPLVQRGGSYAESPFIRPSGWSTNDIDTTKAQTIMAGGRRGCGCAGSKLMAGGKRRHTKRGAGGKRRRTQRGGSKGGYMVDPSISVGGSGPNMAALYSATPCDRPMYQTPLPMYPRAGAPFSLTPNTLLPTQQGGRRYSKKQRQNGGSYSFDNSAPVNGVSSGNSYGNGNGFPASCYVAPGSQLPVYGATTAGFTFSPSTVANGSMTPGITAYEEVVPVAARMGGGARRRHKRRSMRKH